MRLPLFLLIASALLSAAPVFAQQRAIYPGWQNPTGAVLYATQYQYACPQLYSSIERGSSDASSGGQVSALQQFLASYYRVDPSVLVVGYFGPLTQRYVTRFQQERGLSPVGIVGPYTRLEIQKACAAAQVTVPAPVPTPTPAYSYPSYSSGYPQPAVVLPPSPTPQAPSLYSFSPAQGPVGTRIAIIGTDFTIDNTIHFGVGGTAHVPSSNNGTMIAFTVPSFTGPCNPSGNTAVQCGAPVQQVVPGTYPLWVSNENGRTGSVTFTVTAAP